MGRRKYQAAPSWKQHVHINGTIYYSLETPDESWLFHRIITAEDVIDPDIRTAIEDCGHEHNEWLEEADLEDLPCDLELLVHFDDPYRREPIASFLSYQKGVKFRCYPGGDSDSESGYASSSYCAPSYCIPCLISLSHTRSTDVPVVVEVSQKQSFWLAVESYPMHLKGRCHRNLELAFFAALTQSADGTTWHHNSRRIVANTMGVDHIFGQGRAKGRFNYQECKRLIEMFLELKRERVWRIFRPCDYYFMVLCSRCHSRLSRTRVRECCERCPALAPIEGHARHRHTLQTERIRQPASYPALRQAVEDPGWPVILHVLRRPPRIQGTASSSTPCIPCFSRGFSCVFTGSSGGMVW